MSPLPTGKNEMVQACLSEHDFVEDRLARQRHGDAVRRTRHRQEVAYTSAQSRQWKRTGSQHGAARRDKDPTRPNWTR